MATEWAYALLVVCTNEAQGDILAGLIAKDVDDNKTFANGTPVTNGVDNGKFANIPLRIAGRDAVAEFLSDGPYPTWNAKGITDEQIAQFKLIFPATQLGDASIRSQANTFLSTNGWSVVG